MTSRWDPVIDLMDFKIIGIMGSPAKEVTLKHKTCKRKILLKDDDYTDITLWDLNEIARVHCEDKECWGD